MSNMSAAAKEQMFRKDRIFSEPEEQWLAQFTELSVAICADRQLNEKCRNVLLHLKVPRTRILTWGSTPRQRAPRERVLELMRPVMRRPPFAGDNVLVAKLREIAMMYGLTRSELLELHR